MMSNRSFTWGIALLIVVICGCRTRQMTNKETEKARIERPAEDRQADGPEGEHHVDLPWTEEDERAAVELAAALKLTVDSGDYDREANVAPRAVASADAAHLLQIYVFNIGQADSMLIVGPTGRTLLVDLGQPSGGSKPPGFDSSRKQVLKRIKDITSSTNVDYFVVSHYHGDHVGRSAGPSQDWGHGIIGLVSDFSVTFFVGELIHIEDDGAKYMASENERGAYKAIKRLIPLWKQYNRIGKAGPPRFGTDQIKLGPGVTVDILAFAGKVPNGTSAFEKVENAGIDYSETPGNENDLSIALEISAGEFEMFTAGDLNGTDDVAQHPLYVRRAWGEIYTNIEHHMVDYWESIGRESDVEIYRANHHGSGYSSTAKLIEALDPEFILYSTGAQYGHPSNTVVRRGADTARQFATTAVKDENIFEESRGAPVGEIAILVAQDGKSYTINGERHEAFSNSAEKNGHDEGEEDRVH